MNQTKIQWTEKTWNPTTGCVEVSTGCKNCYAKKMFYRLQAMGVKEYVGREFHDVRIHHDRLKYISKLKKPSIIFVDSMSDLFHKDVPFNFIDSIYEVMGWNQQHIFQILTKRPERALKYYNESLIFKIWNEWDNIWLGVSTENQTTADLRIPALLEIPAKIRWLSLEPLLEEINIGKYLSKIDWVVIGAESVGRSPGRKCENKWIENIINQCNEVCVPVFIKQIHQKIGDKYVLNKHDFDSFPPSLQVRNYPPEIKDVKRSN